MWIDVLKHRSWSWMMSTTKIWLIYSLGDKILKDYRLNFRVMAILNKCVTLSVKQSLSTDQLNVDKKN